MINRRLEQVLWAQTLPRALGRHWQQIVHLSARIKNYQRLELGLTRKQTQSLYIHSYQSISDSLNKKTPTVWALFSVFMKRANYIPASTNKSVSYKLRYRYISFYAIYCCYLMYPFRKTTAPTHCYTQLNTHACQKERIYSKNNFFSSKQSESPGWKRKGICH